MEVIANLNASGLRIALVVGQNYRLLGTITDGDIRRALLRGVPMDGLAQNIMFDSPKTLLSSVPREAARNEMLNEKIFQIPIVNSKREVIGLHLWNEVSASPPRDNLVVIMAGGFGKRLRPLTDTCPKPMLPLHGRPILEHVIERLRGEGFSRFILSLHYLGDVITKHFGDGSHFGVEIDYVEETVPLGTAGALSLLDLQETSPIIVTNGDVLTDIGYGAFADWHLTEKATASMAVRQHRMDNPFGVVKLKGKQIVSFEEKPVYLSNVNAGIYALNSDALEMMVHGEYCDMPTLFERLIKAGRRVSAFPMHEDWIDLGRIEDLERAESMSQSSPT